MKILQNNNKISFIDFGIVEVGKSKEVTVIVENDSTAYLENLVFKCEDVKVLEAPIRLDPNASGVVKLLWVPSISLKKPLKAELKVEGIEVYK